MLTHLPLEDLAIATTRICERSVVEIIAPMLNSGSLGIREKGQEGRDLVSEVDLKTESFLKSHLAQLLPEAGFVAEESADGNTLTGLNCIIDPIDGTTNLIHGLPPYCISVALAHEKDVLVGVVFEITLKECFYAWKGGGAYLNGLAIRVSNRSLFKESLLCTGFPYNQENQLKLSAYLDLLGRFLKTTRGVRRLGAAAVDLAYVAAGRLDGFYEYDLQPWDVAAGSLLVAEAKGKVTDFNGKGDFSLGKHIAASNGHIHERLIAELHAFKNQISPE
ncbi:MAG: inositol monophosphatase family protein [Cryomorphaceae bacterium]